MKNKRHDQVFTPSNIVEKMLDSVGYMGENIRVKTIFEPSFGDGVFLIAILNRILDYSNDNNIPKDEIIQILNNVHGIEIDRELYEKTIQSLSDILSSIEIEYDWPNLICGDTMTLAAKNKFDICIGNPPYLRVHAQNDSERSKIKSDFIFGDGNTDLYVIFFEIGLNSLNSNGKLCYITPNSFLKNSSQKKFRIYLAENNMVESIVDYGANKVFSNADTYVAITLLNKNKPSDKTKYEAMKLDENGEFVVDYKSNVNLLNFNSSPWNITNEDDDKFIQKIKSRKVKLSDLCDIQYGLATNADKIYIISKKEYDLFEPSILRPIIKGSTLNSDDSIIFPYEFNQETKRYELISQNKLFEEYPNTYNYLRENKEKLLSRDLENNAVWYQYGRSQGIQNSNKKKFVLKHILPGNAKKCEFVEVNENTLVYSGIFITVKNEKDVERVRRVLNSKDLAKWLLLSGKDMSGGYKAVKASDIKNFGIN